MPSIGWLHLADLHWTLRRPGWTAPHVRRQIQDDLESLHERTGPWDLVVVAGDLSLRGAPEELDEAGKTLDELLDHLRRLGSDPCLLAVPGNHDLVRPHEPSPGALRALRRWHEDPAVREEFWNDPESPARRLVDRAFEPFERWWNARSFPERVSVRRGLLPGDFTATLEKDGLRFGVAGLCTAFLQVTSDDYQGRLAVAPHQLTVAAGGDVPAWVARHDAVVLVTHHPPSWLAPDERRRFEAAIHPAGRFAAHLTAHLHEAASLVETGERVRIATSSFMGLPAWEDRRGNAGARRFGYAAARLDFDGEHGRLEALPRVWTKDGIRPAAELAELDRTGAITLPARRFPRLDEAAPGPALERAALRDALAAIYRAPEDALRLAREACVPTGRSPQTRGGAAVDVWHVVLSEADRHRKLGSIVKIAGIEYPSAGDVTTAWSAFQRAAMHASATPGVRRGSPEEKLADAIYEALTKVPPAVFEAVLSALSLTAPLPGPNAPQATRAIALVRLMERDGTAGLERLAAVLMYVAAFPPPPQRPIQRDEEPSIGTWLLPLAGGVAIGVALAMLRTTLAARRARPRRPTANSLAKLLTLMFADERDFDGFCLDHFPAAYARFTGGMSRAHRIRALLDAADPIDVSAQLKRAHPSAFAEHQRVLDYEDDEARSGGR